MYTTKKIIRLNICDTNTLYNGASYKVSKLNTTGYFGIEKRKTFISKTNIYKNRIAAAYILSAIDYI